MWEVLGGLCGALFGLFLILVVPPLIAHLIDKE